MSIPDRSEPIRGGQAMPSQDVRGDDEELTIGFSSIFPDRWPPVDFGIYPDVSMIGTNTTNAVPIGMIAGASTN